MAFAMNPNFNWQQFGGNALQDLGYGLSNGGPTVWSGLGAATRRSQEMQPYRDQQQTLEEQRKQDALEKNQTSEWIAANFPQYSNLPPAQAWQAAMGDLAAQRNASTGADLTTDQRNWMFAQENPEFASFLNENGGGVEYGFTPQWFQNPDGTFGYGVQGKDGSFKPVQPPPGATMLDPRTLNSEKAFGTATGKASGEATAAAPGDIASGQAALNIIDQIRTSPELDWATGFSAGMGGNRIPGTGRYDFQNLVDQAKSGAFLTAVQEMRGLGSLSNAEGGAATQAITRMDTATSKDAFLKALADYEAIVQRGIARAQARLNAGGPQQQPAGQSTSTGVTWSYEP